MEAILEPAPSTPSQSRTLYIAGGVALHLLVLAVPASALGGVGAILQPSAWLLMFLSSIWVTLEAAAAPAKPTISSNNKLDGFARRVAAACALSILFVFWASLLSAGAPSVIAISSGAILMLLGIFLRVAAIVQLGRQFRTEIAAGSGQWLVTNGIYSKLRHPSEAGLLLLCLGAGVLMSSAWGIVFAVVLIAPLTVWRVRIEERSLRNAFGNAYAEYARSVGGFVPKLR